MAYCGIMSNKLAATCSHYNQAPLQGLTCKPHKFSKTERVLLGQARDNDWVQIKIVGIEKADAHYRRRIRFVQ